MMNENKFLERITINPQILDGKVAIRERLAVEQVLELLAAGETFETMVATYPWLEPEDIQACLLYVIGACGVAGAVAGAGAGGEVVGGGGVNGASRMLVKFQ